jgi:hypothetical protein
MKRLSLKAGVIIFLILLLMSLPVSQTLALAQALDARTDAVQSVSPPVHPKMPSAGLAGPGAARYIDPVVVRNVIIGLVFLSLWALSVASNSE